MRAAPSVPALRTRVLVRVRPDGDSGPTRDAYTCCSTFAQATDSGQHVAPFPNTTYKVAASAQGG